MSPSATTSPTLDGFATECRQRVNSRLEYWLDAQPPLALGLTNAMRYAAANGGKRMRPMLVYGACQALGGDLADADDAAVAIELIHAYSLVHDDLPAMDDDALRRGQPTCHIAYGEALAILAGDALQTLAFEVIASSPLRASASTRVEMLITLARASGAHGMAGGQALDLAAEGQQLKAADLEKIHAHKTGSLIRASVRLGGLLAPHSNIEQLAALDTYAKHLGLAFQVHDDVLDVIGATAELGKQAGADQALAKATYPALLGLEQAKQWATQLAEQALTALVPFDAAADPLRQLARYAVERRH